MATQQGMTPDHNQARDSLNAASHAENATQNPPLPWVFFALQATQLATICIAQMLPTNASWVITIIALITLVVTGTRWVFRRPGYGVVWPDAGGMFPYLMAMLLGVGIPAALAIGLDAPWLWIAAAVVAAVITLEMGRWYRKAARDG